MGDKFLKLLGIVVLVSCLICICVGIVMVIGGLDITNGCLYRYQDTGVTGGSGGHIGTIRADGNYGNDFGQWKSTSRMIAPGQPLRIEITGEVSLCKAYVPRYNLETNGNTVLGNVVEIPRIDEPEPALPFIFDARRARWSNVARLGPGDKIRVTLNKEQYTANSYQKSTMNNTTYMADCSEGKKVYHPLCGRFTVWSSGQNLDNCQYIADCRDCNCFYETYYNSEGEAIGYSDTLTCDRCDCYQPIYANIPYAYQKPESGQDIGYHTFPRSNDVTNYGLETNINCDDDHAYIMGEYQDKRYSWFSANLATNVLYRYHTSESPPSANETGSDYTQLQIISSDQNESVVFDGVNASSSTRYLQFKFNDQADSYGDNSGGYVFNVKQTSCRRENGLGVDFEIPNRGAVEYVIAPLGQDPNISMADTVRGVFNPGSNNIAEITTNGTIVGKLWLRIINKDSEYKNSIGNYKVTINGNIGSTGSFLQNILNPLFEELKSRISITSEYMFRNMTCYSTGNSSCTNYFNYLRALLSIYISIYGMMFLTGNTQITQSDLVVRVVKIALIAGLINEGTYKLFSNYVYPFVWYFSDEIISNMSGYASYVSPGQVSHPFAFLNELMTKIFFSPTFMAQVLALLSMGLAGFAYFIIVLVALVFVIIAVLKAIAIYIMAFVAVNILMALAPIFLVFILFEPTRFLFENWVRFTLRYLIEPVILLAGIIILTQLFTVYLDYVISYSVCWKCAMEFKIPFPSLSTQLAGFLDMPIFCLNWFGAWGHTNSTGQLGMDMTNMIALLMIAICMKSYVEFSGKIVAQLAAYSGGPSATKMGMSMYDMGQEGALSKIGMDRQTRASIKSGAAQRIRSSVENLKNGNPAAGNESLGGSGRGGEAARSNAPSARSAMAGKMKSFGVGDAKNILGTQLGSAISSGLRQSVNHDVNKSQNISSKDNASEENRADLPKENRERFRSLNELDRSSNNKSSSGAKDGGENSNKK